MAQSSLSNTVTSLLERIKLQVTVMDNGDNKIRKEMLILARSLYLAIETPMEAILRMEWAEPELHAAIRVALDLGIFEKLAANGRTGMSAVVLAELSGADPILVCKVSRLLHQGRTDLVAWYLLTNSTKGRMLKHLAAMSVIREVGADIYQNTPMSDALNIPSYRAGIEVGSSLFRPALLALPTHLSRTNYKNPTDISQGAFQLGHQTTDHMFSYFGTHPTEAADFNNHMIGYSASRARWVDPGCVPVVDILGQINGATGEAAAPVLLVDVGGGSGHDLELFRKRYSEAVIPGRLILQDLPLVITAHKKELTEGIEAMEYDFFTKQPVEGARAYYLHSILHDWPDDKCREILTILKAAMTKGYSKILINENVIPATEASWEATGLDILIMSMLSSGERSEQQWRHLLESVGLKIVHIWTYEIGTESLIEVELA